jgi:hypothetical protein
MDADFRAAIRAGREAYIPERLKKRPLTPTRFFIGVAGIIVLRVAIHFFVLPWYAVAALALLLVVIICIVGTLMSTRRGS